MPDSLTPEELSLEHAKLRSDFDIVSAYAEEHPDEWTEALYENEPTVRVVVLVAGSRDDHDRVLRGLVSHPDQLEVRKTKFAQRQLQEIVDEVRPQWRTSDPGTFLSMGVARGKVRIQVRADQEHLAAALTERYGDALEIKVGAFVFPMTVEDHEEDRSHRETLRSEIALLEQMDVAIVGVFRVTSGRNQNGALEFTNHGPNEMVLDTNGAITAQVVDPVTGTVVGGFVGAQTAQLFKYSLPSMTTVRVPLLVGTASARPEIGYAVPPGNWMIDAIIKLHDVGERRLPPMPIVICEREE